MTAGQRWSRDRPSRPGWYWFRNTDLVDEHEPRIVYLRDYVRGLAVGNCHIDGFTRYEEGEWCGPLEPPHDQEAG